MFIFLMKKNIKSAKSANKNFYWPYLGLSGSMQKDVCSILKYTFHSPSLTITNSPSAAANRRRAAASSPASSMKYRRLYIII